MTYMLFVVQSVTTVWIQPHIISYDLLVEGDVTLDLVEDLNHT